MNRIDQLHRHSALTAVALAVLLAITACSSDDSEPAADQTPNDELDTPVLDEQQVSTDPGRTLDTSVGTVFVFGESDRTAYLFLNDGDGVSNCSQGCAANWPPILADGPSESGAFETVTRADGTYQWAFNNRPLYYFAGDASAGEINGEGVNGVWFVARPNPIGTAGAGTDERLIGTGTISSDGLDSSNRISRNGYTLYTFRNDSTDVSVCNGGCAQNWPPLFADSGATADSEFTLLSREDGTVQWARNGRALYFYTGDSQPGDTNGDGVGGVWDVARP